MLLLVLLLKILKSLAYLWEVLVGICPRSLSLSHSRSFCQSIRKWCQSSLCSSLGQKKLREKQIVEDLGKSKMRTCFFFFVFQLFLLQLSSFEDIHWRPWSNPRCLLRSVCLCVSSWKSLKTRKQIWIWATRNAQLHGSWHPAVFISFEDRHFLRIIFIILLQSLDGLV